LFSVEQGSEPQEKRTIMSSTGKFEVATIAPELLKLGHTELYKISKAWKRYLNIRKERNAVLPEGQKMIPASLVSCIDPDLLRSLVWTENIEGCDDAGDVTDTYLDTWINASLGEAATTATTEDIASMVLRKVRINLQENDCGMTIDQLVSDYLTLSREQGWTLIKKQPKLTIKHLIPVLKPAHLKELCENDLNLMYIELRKDFPGFIKHLRARAAVAELLLAPGTAKMTSPATRRRLAAPPGAPQVGLTQVLGQVPTRTVPLAPPRARLQSVSMIRNATRTGRQTITT
jgi:hypothetical protein